MTEYKPLNPGQNAQLPFKADLHVHLHGCLTATDLWEIGQSCYKKRNLRLSWYEDQFAAVFGQKPNSRLYWEQENGFGLLKNDFECKEAESFASFQARFNLIIALCPITPDDFSVQKTVIDKVAAEGLDYFEARTIIPLSFTQSDAHTYLKNLCECVDAMNAKHTLVTRLVFSLDQDPLTAKAHYDWIRSFINSEKQLGKLIVGLDFAGYEEQADLLAKRQVFQTIKSDNETWQPLHVSYHVGETFETMSMMSSILRVLQAVELGADRLGHASSLGLDPQSLSGQSFLETKANLQGLNAWLRQVRGPAANTYNPLPPDTFARLARPVKDQADFVSFEFDSELIGSIRSLQQIVANIIKNSGAVIEVCPSSSSRISKAAKQNLHPLHFFAGQEMKMVIGSDDPGVFGTTWQKEAEIFCALGGDLKAASKTAASLVGRS